MHQDADPLRQAIAEAEAAREPSRQQVLDDVTRELRAGRADRSIRESLTVLDAIVDEDRDARLDEIANARAKLAPVLQEAERKRESLRLFQREHGEELRDLVARDFLSPAMYARVPTDLLHRLDRQLKETWKLYNLAPAQLERAFEKAAKLTLAGIRDGVPGHVVYEVTNCPDALLLEAALDVIRRDVEAVTQCLLSGTRRTTGMGGHVARLSRPEPEQTQAVR